MHDIVLIGSRLIQFRTGIGGTGSEDVLHANDYVGATEATRAAVRVTESLEQLDGALIVKPVTSSLDLTGRMALLSLPVGKWIKPSDGSLVAAVIHRILTQGALV